jgi:hypothetical protein
MKKMGRIAFAATSAALACALAANVQAAEVDAEMLLQLKQLIEQQQRQLDQQASEIAKLKQQVVGATAEIEKKVDKEEVTKNDVEKMVTSSFENVDVNLYGQLNKGVLWSDNGNSSKVYFVDNDNSQSRLGLNASVSPTEDITVGGRIEYGVVSNSSSDVSELDTYNATSVTWNLRWADIFFQSDSLGKIYLGKGSTASDNTAEVDLSGTDVVAYADVAALNGGQYWYDDTSAELTDVRVKNVFNDMDGLGRQDRIRYDTPSFAGLVFSTSASSGDAFDAALKYSREFGETKLAAAVAWASPGDIIEDVSNQYDGSVSILLGNGLNGTFSFGDRDVSARGKDDATFLYGKLGYRFDAWTFGTTSLSIDYGQTDDLVTNGDTAKTWALAAVQDVPSWGTEFYLAYRNYSLDTDLGSINDINAVLGGARVKF